MERVKVLSAAAALRDFTVDELVALSGVNANSVRSVLKRSPEFVHRLGATHDGQRGRPSTKWAIVDSATSSKLIAELNALSNTEVPRFEPRWDDRHEVAVSMAEDALSQVVEEGDLRIRRKIIKSAQFSLRISDHSSTADEPWWQDDSSSFAVRARGVDSLANLSTTLPGEMSDDLLTTTALDIAAAMTAIPDRGDAVYFAPMSQVLADHGSFAPVFAVGEYEPLPLFGEHWTELHASGLELDAGRVLTQSWAEPLVGISAAMPMLFASSHGEGTSSAVLIRELLGKIRTTSRPALVFGDVDQTELMRVSAVSGASFVPFDVHSSGDRQFAIDAVAAAIDRHAAR